MNMKDFSARNLARCVSPEGFNHPLDQWSLSDWMTAVVGELGEAANVLKKLNRVRDGVTGNSETPEQLRQMFADELVGCCTVTHAPFKAGSLLVDDTISVTGNVPLAME